MHVLLCALLLGGRPSSPLVFTHVTVIDGTGASPSADMTLVVTGDRITSVGRTGTVAVPTAARVIDAQGKYLIPGLWDMHVHFWHPDTRQLLPLYVASGVTGVRAMAEDIARVRAWREAIGRGEMLGPRIVTTGAGLDGEPPDDTSIPIRAVKTPEEARAAVAALEGDGADFVKVLSALRSDVYGAIAEEAKRRRLPFVGHVPDAVAAADASDAGQASLEHLFGIALGCCPREKQLRAGRLDALSRKDWPAYEQIEEQIFDGYDPRQAEALLARFVGNGTWQVPSLVLLKRMAYEYDGDPSEDPRLRYVPPSIKAGWKSPLNELKGASERTRARLHRRYARSLEIVGAMRRAGVPILAGTDTGDPFTYPGLTLHDELALLVAAGLTPLEALRSATSSPARFLGRLDSLGTLEPGKAADLVLLEADPLAAITNTRRIDSVVIGGRLIGREEREAILASLAAAGR